MSTNPSPVVSSAMATVIARNGGAPRVPGTNRPKPQQQGVAA